MNFAYGVLVLPAGGFPPEPRPETPYLDRAQGHGAVSSFVATIPCHRPRVSWTDVDRALRGRRRLAFECEFKVCPDSALLRRAAAPDLETNAWWLRRRSTPALPPNVGRRGIAEERDEFGVAWATRDRMVPVAQPQTTAASS